MNCLSDELDTLKGLLMGEKARIDNCSGKDFGKNLHLMERTAEKIKSLTQGTKAGSQMSFGTQGQPVMHLKNDTRMSLQVNGYPGGKKTVLSARNGVKKMVDNKVDLNINPPGHNLSRIFIDTTRKVKRVINNSLERNSGTQLRTAQWHHGEPKTLQSKHNKLLCDKDLVQTELDKKIKSKLLSLETTELNSSLTKKEEGARITTSRKLMSKTVIAPKESTQQVEKSHNNTVINPKVGVCSISINTPINSLANPKGVKPKKQLTTQISDISSMVHFSIQETSDKHQVQKPTHGKPNTELSTRFSTKKLLKKDTGLVVPKSFKPMHLDSSTKTKGHIANIKQSISDRNPSAPKLDKRSSAEKSQIKDSDVIRYAEKRIESQAESILSPGGDDLILIDNSLYPRELLDMKMNSYRHMDSFLLTSVPRRNLKTCFKADVAIDIDKDEFYVSPQSSDLWKKKKGVHTCPVILEESHMTYFDRKALEMSVDITKNGEQLNKRQCNNNEVNHLWRDAPRDKQAVHHRLEKYEDMFESSLSESKCVQTIVDDAIQRVKGCPIFPKSQSSMNMTPSTNISINKQNPDPCSNAKRLKTTQTSKNAKVVDTSTPNSKKLASPEKPKYFRKKLISDAKNIRFDDPSDSDCYLSTRPHMKQLVLNSGQKLPVIKIKTR